MDRPFFIWDFINANENLRYPYGFIIFMAIKTKMIYENQRDFGR